jgi:hypothetical protein
MSLGNRVQAPGEAAWDYLRQRAAAAARDGDNAMANFGSDVGVKALANAAVSSTVAGDAAAHMVIGKLYELARNPKSTVNDFKHFVAKDIRDPYVAKFGEADSNANMDRFVARATVFMAAAKELGDDLRALGTARTVVPPGGVIDNIIANLTTRERGFRGMKFSGIVTPQDQARAIQETMDLLQDMGMGVESSSRVGVDTKSVLASFGGSVAAQQTLVQRWLSSDAGDVMVPKAVYDAILEEPRALAKDLEQFNKSAGQNLTVMGILDALARRNRMQLVAGHWLFRFTMLSQDVVGDYVNMAMMMGPMDLARNIAKTAPQTVPLLGKVISNKALDDILDGKQGVYRAVEGDVSYDRLAREMVEQGTTDSIVARDTYDALMDGQRMKRSADATSWVWNAMVRTKEIVFDQSAYVKYMTTWTEAAMNYKRKSVYLHFRSTMTADEAGKAMRDTLVDWSGGVADWERGSWILGRMSAFWSHTKGVMNLHHRLILDDLADIDAGRAAQVLLVGKSKRPMVAERLFSIPSALEDAALDDQERNPGDNLEAWERSRRPGYMSDMWYYYSEVLPEGMRTRMKDAYGRDVTVSSVYLARQNTQTMLANSLFAYGAAQALVAGLDPNDGVMAKWDTVAHQAINILLTNFSNEPYFGKFIDESVRQAAGMPVYKQSAESEEKFGTYVPPTYAAALNDLGLGQYTMVRRSEPGDIGEATGRYVWRNPTAAKAMMVLPEVLLRGVLECARYGNAVQDANERAMYDGWANAYARMLFDLTGFTATGYTNASKDARMQESAKATTLQSFSSREQE